MSFPSLFLATRLSLLDLQAHSFPLLHPPFFSFSDPRMDDVSDVVLNYTFFKLVSLLSSLLVLAALSRRDHTPSHLPSTSDSPPSSFPFFTAELVVTTEVTPSPTQAKRPSRQPQGSPTLNSPTLSLKDRTSQRERTCRRGIGFRLELSR